MKNTRMIELKPNAEMAMKRSEAFWNKDMIDRPIMIAKIKKPNADIRPGSHYWERCFGDPEKVFSDELHNAMQYEYLGEAIPQYWMSLGTHEIAQYCGYDITWSPDKQTNWCVHTDKELEDLLPLQIDENNYFWKRSHELYAKAAEMWQGRIIPMSYDFHSNMDLLLSVRGDANLCMDLYDCPDTVKRGLKDACTVFEKMWNAFVEHSQAEKYGYQYAIYSDKPTTLLACDFCALIGEEMFDEFALPCLIHESEIVGERCVWHWDGPDALKHLDSLVSIKNLHTVDYTPSPGTHGYQFLDSYQRVQEKGKGVVFGGTFEQIKEAAKVLKPNLTIYLPQVKTVSEFEEVEEWLTKNS